jgi:DDE superfamily endonuclease
MVYTWAKKGSKEVPIQGADSSGRATAMLGTNASGTHKLPPFLIFQGSAKRTGRIYQELQKRDGYPADLEYAVQKRAWMDEATMIQWIEKVWKPCTDGKGGRCTYLLLDECTSHLTSKVAQAFQKCNTEIDIIPWGYTAKLQALDVGLNTPFKSYCRTSFDSWIERFGCQGAPPHRRDASEWVKQSWARVTKKMIQKTWNKIGYTAFDIEGTVTMEANTTNNNNNEELITTDSNNNMLAE